MLKRNVGRWLCLFLIVWTSACAVISCGGGGGDGTFTPNPTSDGSVALDGTTPGYGDGSFLGHDAGNGCKPKTCQQLGYDCGKNSDGCGNILDCGSCKAPEYCGGGGYSKCGGQNIAPDGNVVNQCTPYTCATAPKGPYNCGQTGDGCGNVLNCGTCKNPEYCGGGGFNTCGGNNGLNPDGGVPCVPATQCPAGQNCGQAADGCGGLLNCGNCLSPQFCGGGGPSQCGGNNGLGADGGVVCVPATQCPAGQNCGFAADGCGGLLSCGTCTSPQFCGGGGANKCGGNNGQNPDGSVQCTPSTCASLGNPCGQQSDGCGGVLNCTQCVLPQTCGGGGVANQCGGNNGVAPDGGLICTPKTCANYPAGTCGQQDDGCGGLTVSCGSCTLPLTCGGGGVPSQCGNKNLGVDGGNVCVPATKCPAGENCGVAADGCGGLLNCGTCTAPLTCGGGGVAGQCGNSGLGSDGGVLCTPKTCATAPGGPYNCGQVGDGCGGLTANCGSCTSPQYCGGGGANVCGPTNISQCDSGVTTSLTGYVFDPANNLPVYNALVYVPQGAVQTPTTGVNVANPVCGCTSPPAYTSAFTDISGKFTLPNPPTGAGVQVVVQLGKWQRVFSETITSCAANNLGGGTAGSAANLTLPANRSQGNIPRFAIDTGAVDSMECVLLKMGIAQSEFTDPTIAGGVPTAAGRIHMYQGSVYNGGAIIDANTPTEDKLTETASVMNSYDVILFPCQGGAGSYTSANGWPNTWSNLLSYTGAGGRMFATHFHYDLLDGNGSFSGTATWATGTGSWGNYYSDTKFNTTIDTSFARGVTLGQWLHQAIVYGGTLDQIPVGVIRNDFSAVNAPAQRWLYTNNDTGQGGPGAGVPIHYTFDTPFNQSPTCGRVVYSDFHVESEVDNNGYNGVGFPNECPSGAMTPQEKLLEFMLFDLTSCVSPPSCTPKTCAAFPGKCGQQGDGCGGLTAFCNPCTAPQTCGGGGTPDQCGYPDAGCAQLTCANYPATTCGVQSNGCGGQTPFCNPCTPPATCGGGGTPGQCGYPDAGCTKATCQSLGYACGSGSDGCGGSVSCGTCPMGQGCVNNQCVVIDAGSSCVPETCQQLGVQCGQVDNGCGTLLTCATCPMGQTCVHNQCVSTDGGACTPLTCANYPSTTCGEQGDGCGGHTAFCNPCTPPQTCGGGGTPNQCGYPDAGCVPLTCADFPSSTCGPQADGCGGVTAFCNPCTLPQTCGGGGTSGQCGYPDGGACVPQTCAQQNIHCGPAGDGCGNVIQCGPCTAPQTCGGGGVPSQCGEADTGTCKPLTCASQHIACGPAGDGCGNLLMCGMCSSPQTCGGGGTPGQCGGGAQ